MQLVSLSKLNTACGSSLRRVLIGQVKSREQGNLVAHLCFKGQILNQGCNSVRFYSSHRINQYLVNPTAASFCCRVIRNPMAASGSQSVAGDVCVDTLFMGCGNLSDIAKPAAVFFGDKSVNSCRKSSISLANRDPPFMRLVFPGLAYRSWDSRSFLGKCLRHYHASSSASCSDGAAADVPFDISPRDVPLENPADTSAWYALPFSKYFLFEMVQVYLLWLLNWCCYSIYERVTITSRNELVTSNELQI